LPDSWEWVRISTFTRIGTGSTPSRGNPLYYSPAEISWVTSGETQQDFIFETREKISPLALKETNVSVYPIGSLVVAMYGQGKTRGQVSELMIEAGTNQACAVIQFIEQSEAHRKYIKLFYKKAYEELRSNAAGGAQPNLNVGKISLTVIPLPPLAEQHRIVTKVDELMTLCEQLKTKLATAQTLQQQLADTLVQQAVA
jgi:type I restriction enzyme S subunit